MDTLKKETLIAEVLNIAVDAGKVIMKIYDEDDFDVEMKGDDSPLTKADKAANDLIVKALAELDSTIPIITEEQKAMDYEVRKDWKHCWMVDPLDGTKEFIKRNGEFTVNIAMIEDGRSVAGVVYAPVLDQLFWAIEGQGAFIKTNGEITKLEANKYSTSDAKLRFVCSRSHLNQETSDFMGRFEDPQTVSKGSSLKFLVLAMGDAEIYPRLAPTMEWDTAAAHIVLQEAGGSVIDNDTKQPLRYNKENLLNPFFIASGNESS